MDSLSKVVKVTVPNYLSDLPIPESIGGIFRLSVKDWLRLLPFVGTVSFFSWVTYTRFFPSTRHLVNPTIQKDSSKVVHAFDIEDLDKKTCLCRCWRSKKFPLCDGSHNLYNTLAGDNVGPVMVSKK